jgi:hypothetical protein
MYMPQMLTMNGRLLALILTLGLGTPSALLACSCTRRAPAGQPVPRDPRSIFRPRVFIGHVLAVDETLTRPTRMTVRFVTESSWKGPLPDTVTLRVTSDAPCAYYTAGGRYIVFADAELGPANWKRHGWDIADSTRVPSASDNPSAPSLRGRTR